MGTCEYCGTHFPLTRATRKYCTPRCRTNACLDRKPRRIRAADIDALCDLAQAEISSAELRARLRSILFGTPVEVIPDYQPEPERVFIPRME